MFKRSKSRHNPVKPLSWVHPMGLPPVLRTQALGDWHRLVVWKEPRCAQAVPTWVPLSSVGSGHLGRMVRDVAASLGIAEQLGLLKDKD